MKWRPFLFAVVVLAAGCGDEVVQVPAPVEEPVIEKETDVPSKVNLSSYFLKDGQIAHFVGEGNEFASYTTRTVWHDDRHVTVYEDNGGTVMARTFRVEDERIVVVREEGEQYEDYVPSDGELESLKPLYTYLQLPLEVGQSFDGWTVIDDSSPLETPLQTFDHAVVLEKIGEDGSIVRSYFAEGFGEVKREFMMDDFIVSSMIEQIEEPAR
ncbi:hypothetical protein AWH48_03700 [Domibacillus aminovorans]|uniref:Uncharacterized protein n=1 Tax=Domibacillus aminovorans TaxID=29332 RepID=A0A177KR33_9BACI|nr:hypothetical protein [Domibacillus aminovorans]OAH55789.1 hypothetical protein AWH48_03700 [Domibacillus aminovorans]